MKVGIPLSTSAYTPEAYAYEKYLKAMGYEVQLDYNLDPNNDINIHFMGTRPFWKSNKGRALEIHEYQSLSTPPYAKLKNYSKRIINKKPVGRIFLNNFVHQDLHFNDNIPYIYRDMGVDQALFQNPLQNPLYDIIYCGSITGRIGLVETLLKLAKDYRIIVVGKITEEEKKLLQVNNITLMGPVNRDQLPEIYKNARLERKVRIEAAKAALPYEFGKVGEMGIKEGREQAAGEVAKTSKFATADERRKQRENQRVS